MTPKIKSPRQRAIALTAETRLIKLNRISKSTTKQSTKATEIVRQTTPKATTKATTKKTTAQAEQYDFVANINSGKYHYSWCASVKRMNEENKKFYHCSSAEMRAKGYEPCDNCNP